MDDTPLHEILPEPAFAELLGPRSRRLFGLLRRLQEPGLDAWRRGHFFLVVSEADAVEALLDDHGARHNRTFSLLRELVASARSLALAGFSVAHLERRFPSYSVALSLSELDRAVASVRRVRTFLQRAVVTLLVEARAECAAAGAVLASDDGGIELDLPEDTQRRSLPRNLEHEDLEDDERKVAEFAAKYLGACDLLAGLGLRRIVNAAEREAWLRANCTEERARTYESTVHNLQSAYDTWIKNTLIEEEDGRLPRLRGHVSGALHLLEAVTQLTHFVDRHESGLREDRLERRLEQLVHRADVRELTHDHLLTWAGVLLARGRALAEELLPSYMNMQELEVELPDGVLLHARPAALIVGVVNRYGTPVEMEIAGRRCNAASILDLMVAVGSNPETRRFSFRGDAHPLEDLRHLFAHGLGENGLEALPARLAYLRGAD